MDTNQTTAPVQAAPAIAQAADAPKTPRNGKIAKIKRKETSFRPGRSEEAASAKSSGLIKRLHFTIPSASELASPEEAGEVQKIAMTLGNHYEHGKIASFSCQDGYWEVVFALASNTIAEDEDEILSDVFRDLMPTIDSLPNLCNGFRSGAVATWEYRVGANVLDQGNLS